MAGGLLRGEGLPGAKGEHQVAAVAVALQRGGRFISNGAAEARAVLYLVAACFTLRVKQAGKA